MPRSPIRAAGTPGVDRHACRTGCQLFGRALAGKFEDEMRMGDVPCKQLLVRCLEFRWPASPCSCRLCLYQTRAVTAPPPSNIMQALLREGAARPFLVRREGRIAHGCRAIRTGSHVATLLPVWRRAAVPLPRATPVAQAAENSEEVRLG